MITNELRQNSLAEPRSCNPQLRCGHARPYPNVCDIFFKRGTKPWFWQFPLLAKEGVRGRLCNQNQMPATHNRHTRPYMRFRACTTDHWGWQELPRSSGSLTGLLPYASRRTPSRALPETETRPCVSRGFARDPNTRCVYFTLQRFHLSLYCAKIEPISGNFHYGCCSIQH